jgi:hypothetical protein
MYYFISVFIIIGTIVGPTRNYYGWTVVRWLSYQCYLCRKLLVLSYTFISFTQQWQSTLAQSLIFIRKSQHNTQRTDTYVWCPLRHKSNIYFFLNNFHGETTATATRIITISKYSNHVSSSPL